MDVIFLTGANSEPAQSIARRLVGAGFRVYGFAAQFSKQGFQHRDFFQVPANLADANALRAEVASILANETTPAGVILAGNYAVEEPFEATHPEDVSLALNAGVISQIVLARAVLPSLIRQRGSVIAITQTPANSGFALAAAVGGALEKFTRALFLELRDTGVKTAHLRLENNTGAIDAAARFTHAPQSQIQPDIVADAVETILRLRENNAITELVLRPQATREEPRLPVSAEPRLRTIQVVQLPPPKNFPPPQESIPTPERKRPDYAPPPDEIPDDLFDDNDEGVDPELLYLIKPNYQRHLSQNSGNDTARPQNTHGGVKKNPPVPQGNFAQKNPPRERNPRNGALRIRPQNSVENRPQHQETFLPYPQNWHWPRPPSPQQLEKIARKKAQQQNPNFQRNPQKFQPGNFQKNPRADIPVFVPPVSQNKPSDFPEFSPNDTALPAQKTEVISGKTDENSGREKSPDAAENAGKRTPRAAKPRKISPRETPDENGKMAPPVSFQRRKTVSAARKKIPET